MGSSNLPVELTDRIIDFCHNDKKTLPNCALTHSSWLPASRFHLFHTITTRARKGTDRETQFKSLIRRRSSAVSHRWSSILPYIRTVKITSPRSFDTSLGLKNPVNFAHTIRRFCCLARLPGPSVHVNLPGYALQSLSPVSDIVTHVRLSNVTFVHPNDIWLSLSSFPRLQYLELENLMFRPSAESGFPADSTFDGIPLSTVRLTTVSMGFIIRCLTRVAGSLSHLDDFGIAYQDIRQGELLQLARAIQRRVKYLRFSASCYPDDERVGEWRPSAFDIRIPEFVGCFRSLQTLVLDNLRVDGSSHYDGFDVSFEWITGVLQQLSSPVQKLVFEVIAMDCSQLNAIPWASIDKIVDPETPQFRTLICVKVLVKRGLCPKDYPPSIRRDAVCSEIALKLPALNLLGLLLCDTAGCE